MAGITLGRSDYRDKVLGCWMGKSIGGTLGEKWEGRLHTHALTFYEPLPEKSSPNDDLDLQLVWLKMLEDRGIEPVGREPPEVGLTTPPGRTWKNARDVSRASKRACAQSGEVAGRSKHWMKP